jgi:catechol 2,3-dioxygenase-like lactoylglutathione lyase family enzyme
VPDGAAPRLAAAYDRSVTAAGAPLGTAIPTLPSRDFDVTVAFYTSLGFSELRRWDDYLIVVRDALELHFFVDESVDWATTNAGCYLRVPDAPGLWDAWAGAGVPLSHRGAPRLQGPPWDTEYGLREFALVDPDGSLIRVGSPVA